MHKKGRHIFSNTIISSIVISVDYLFIYATFSLFEKLGQSFNFRN